MPRSIHGSRHGWPVIRESSPLSLEAMSNRLDDNNKASQDASHPPETSVGYPACHTRDGAPKIPSSTRDEIEMGGGWGHQPNQHPRVPGPATTLHGTLIVAFRPKGHLRRASHCPTWPPCVASGQQDRGAGRRFSCHIAVVARKRGCWARQVPVVGFQRLSDRA